MPTERPLTQKERDWIADWADEAMANAGLPEGEVEPAAIVEAIEAIVDEWQVDMGDSAPQRFRHGQDPTPIAIALGCAWGNQLVDQFAWEWIGLEVKGKQFFVVANRRRSFVIYPIRYIEACMNKIDADCTVALAFNMLAAGNITDAPANSYNNLMAGILRIVPKR